MGRRLILPALVPAILLGATCSLPAADDAKDPSRDSPASGGPRSFDMKELSLAEAIGRRSDLAYSGQRVYLGLEKTDFTEDSTKPEKEVRKYPELKCAKPLYGSIQLGSSFPPERSDPYHFVIDGTEPGKYDLLYLDADKDLDLSDDPPSRSSRTKRPEGLWPNGNDENRKLYVFEEMSLPLDFGPETGMRPVRILPLLFFNGDATATLMFVALSCRAGRIEIGGRQFDAILAQPHWVSGRFDRPMTSIHLSRAGNGDSREYWWGADSLGAYRLVDGRYHTLSVTPLGDRITVKPYEGDLGIFKVGAGGREIKEMTVSGSLQSATGAVAIGSSKEDRGSDLEPVGEARIPAGDYTAYYLHVRYGTLRIGLSNNYHSDGKPRDGGRERKFGIAIRKDRPFALDFSDKPGVMFASPAKDATFHPGDSISVKAVLVDPELDLMIRDLDETLEKESNGRLKSLDPLVTITSSAGQTVSEGKMPFG
jgi:hypothetical protein